VAAQTAKDLVGSWSAVSIVNIRAVGSKVELFGANPKAMVIFDGNGHFVLDQENPDIPKFKSNNRTQGTPYVPSRDPGWSTERPFLAASN
jgi:hypothetical protein